MYKDPHQVSKHNVALVGLIIVCVMVVMFMAIMFDFYYRNIYGVAPLRLLFASSVPLILTQLQPLF